MRLLLLLTTCCAFAQTSRELNRLNWMEVRELVPAKTQTVLIPTGTLEAHGVTNNGTDNTIPEGMARAMAGRLNALIAPTLNYGVTGSLDAYAGGLTISPEAYRLFTRDLLTGLARNGFKNLILVNGHGGNTEVLTQVAEEVGRKERVRTLIVNWWSYCSEVTMKVFGEDGGHAGWNETAMVQAIDPKLVFPERYSNDLATARPATGAWAAYPFPSSIILYQPGQGYVKFDQGKADAYFRGCTEKVAGLVSETIRKWDMAGLFR